MRLSSSRTMSLFGAAAAVLAAAPFFAAAASADHIATQCADFLGQRPEQQIASVRAVLSNNSRGYSLADHSSTDESAVRRAIAGCTADFGASVSQAIGEGR